ncbi:MAG: hypothetical protein C0622_07670 [Desulfuromonas sp.]|nr:MAG: hypothetical protein C0622_07670 [Desulfuromonas sp.]
MLKHIVSILLALGIILCAISLPAIQQLSEEEVKSAYLYNFAKFIKWPEKAFRDDHDPFVIGVYGKSGLDEYLVSLTKKKIRERAVEIRTIASVADAEGCQLLYVAAGAERDGERLLQALSGSAIVTVSDAESFVNQGGVIQFVPIRGRLRFIINLYQANHVGLKIDAQLLALAIEVVEEKP